MEVENYSEDTSVLSFTHNVCHKEGLHLSYVALMQHALGLYFFDGLSVRTDWNGENRIASIWELGIVCCQLRHHQDPGYTIQHAIVLGVDEFD
jgi:hypothetical protein